MGIWSVILETERVVLRKFRADDLMDLYEYLSDGETVKYEPCLPMSLPEVEKELAERLGFSREAHFLQNVYFWKDDLGKPIWKDTFVYSLLNE